MKKKKPESDKKSRLELVETLSHKFLIEFEIMVSALKAEAEGSKTDNLVTAFYLNCCRISVSHFEEVRSLGMRNHSCKHCREDQKKKEDNFGTHIN